MCGVTVGSGKSPRSCGVRGHHISASMVNVSMLCNLRNECLIPRWILCLSAFHSCTLMPVLMNLSNRASQNSRECFLSSSRLPFPFRQNKSKNKLHLSQTGTFFWGSSCFCKRLQSWWACGMLGHVVDLNYFYNISHGQWVFTDHIFQHTQFSIIHLHL